MACFSEQIKPNLHLAVAERKHLRPQHRRIGYAHQLKLFLARTRLRAIMKNHGPSGEP